LPFTVDGAEMPEPSAASTQVCRACAFLSGAALLEATRLLHDGAPFYRLMVEVENLSPIPEEPGFGPEHAFFQACHVVVGVRGGRFCALSDAPVALAAQCQNERTWPVLVGDPLRRDLLLCSPIILPDYPTVARESPADLFDGTENDELLTLSILGLPAAERAEASRLDPRAAALIDRATLLDASAQERLHGTFRNRPKPGLAPGGRVVLRPKRRADIFDLALAGRTATILALAQDADDRSFVTVTLDDDPGRDLGAAGFVGHRFYFGLDEVEPLEAP
jgi:hypothetical protein